MFGHIRTAPRATPAVAAAVCALGALSVLAPAAISAQPAAAAVRSVRAVRAASTTVWLCAPGQAKDPCAYPRTATSVSGSGAKRLVISPASRNASRFDCFYVYPTVSKESGNNADLTVQPAESAAAVAQASRFSQVCRRLGADVPAGHD